MFSAITLAILLQDNHRDRELNIVKTFLDVCLTDENRIVDVDFASRSNKWTLGVLDHDGKHVLFSVRGDGNKVENSKANPRITQLLTTGENTPSKKGSKIDLLEYAYKIGEFGVPSQMTYSADRRGSSIGFSILREPKEGQYQFVYGRVRLITYSEKQGYRVIKGY